MSGRIDVVMYRDPDSETELRVFVNGEDVTDELHVIDFDPGRGHTRSDVEEERDAVLSDESIPQPVRDHAAEQYEFMLASPYVEGDRGDECDECGMPAPDPARYPDNDRYHATSCSLHPDNIVGP